ncbi:sensor histidine kinase [Gardnerella vaginalis]|uniref:sensor histidine kinase n=1 Tax=Gardnerella vaginalis TaxID=2702 RepID=UPI00020CDD35|nr:ATP-binding protein [Gardnerella vaginalis]AEF31433.1 ATPase/histidine kinase/DNA gyrase B/HSP90 domain protein [Gardnerella vaginalis HMP9231]
MLQDSPYSPLMVFVVFALIALCVAIVIVMFVVDSLFPIFRSVFRPFFSSVVNPIAGGLRRIFRSSFKKILKILGKRNFGDDEDDEDSVDSNSDDISSDACAILSMLSAATIVIDADNDVLRASSDSYTLGVVVDDSIVQSRVLDSVNRVRESGGFESFDLVTFTPEQYITIGEDSDFNSNFSGDSAVLLKSATVAGDFSSNKTDKSSDASTVSRPNWLNVTVGSVGAGKVVVILNDTSAAHRFEQTRDDFISNVSQQLISSTRMISSLIELLQDSNVTLNRVKEVSLKAQRSSKRLEHMLEDLLLLMSAQKPIDVSKASAVNVLSVLKDVQNQVSYLALSRNVRICVKSDSSLSVLGSFSQISAAVRKLVENAIIYSSANSSVAISALKSDDSQFAVIRVVDCGSGIALRDQPRIFERFYRSDNQNDGSQDGVGLGLAIAKHVALTHHGSITLWSRPGQGTTVNFAIPLSKSDAK